MSDRHFVPGETFAEDPRERRMRVIAQLVDKPLYLFAVCLAVVVAVDGPGLAVPGYQPSGWFSFGLWVLLCILLRLVFNGFLAWFRTHYAIPAPVSHPVAGRGMEE